MNSPNKRALKLQEGSFAVCWYGYSACLACPGQRPVRHPELAEAEEGEDHREDEEQHCQRDQHVVPPPVAQLLQPRARADAERAGSATLTTFLNIVITFR